MATFEIHKNVLNLIILFCAVTTVIGSPTYVVTWNEPKPEHNDHPKHLVGQHMCTRGPAYWCHNIT